MLRLLLACVDPAADDSAPPTPDSAGETGVDSAGETGADSGGDTGPGPSPAWGPTRGTLENAFTLHAAEVTGDDRLAALALAEGAGTLTLAGADHAAVAWLDHDWSEAGYHLYDVLSVADDGTGLAVTWLYAQGDAVPYVYTEGYGLPVDWEYASGALVATADPGVAAVDLPPLRALPPPMDSGFTVSGDLALDAEGGAVSLGGVTRTVHPMGVVDCATCPGGPWYEIHVVLAGDDACFAIVYLFPEEPARAQLEYGLCLPTLERLSAPLDVTWSGAPAARRGPPAPVRGVPPP